MARTIVIRDYDPTWPERFQELRQELWSVVSDFALSIEHVGSTSVPGREAFENPPGEQDHHLYVCMDGSLGLRNHLALRDYLRGNPEAARGYGELKKTLTAMYPHDIDGYIAGKTDYILRILRDCGISADELEGIASANQLP